MKKEIKSYVSRFLAKKLLLIIFLILFIFPYCTSSALSPKPIGVNHDLCPVLRVIDGDTIVVLYHGQKEHIRLLRINTPERGQYGYKQAKSAMGDLLGGRKVRLEFEIPGVLERDKYGRILAYVWVDEVNVNVEMVRLGWSKFWIKYGEGKYADSFRTAEGEARKTKRN